MFTAGSVSSALLQARAPNSRYNWGVMLSVNNITMRFGPRILFENVTCTFMAGRRYAITGPNGAGKSTFMKILTGEIDSTSVSITRPQNMGVLLAQELFVNPRALRLDEPTNNLDLDSVHWLQRYLCEYEGVLIVISHDRHFLNSVCTYTADIDYETIIMYVGGYDDMVVAKTQIRGRIEADNANREKKIAQLQEFIARVSAGTRSAQATSRKKEVERLQTTELARSNIQRPYIKFDMKKNSGRHPLEIRSVEKSYESLKVIPKFSASVVRGEKIALMGRNGAGKTTLLKSLVRNAPGFIEDKDLQFPIDGGEVRWGHEVAVGYFSQDHGESITKGMTAIDWLWQFDPSASQQELRA